MFDRMAADRRCKRKERVVDNVGVAISAVEVLDPDVTLSREEAEEVLRRAEYWHYPFDLAWGRVSASKVQTNERHDQRRRHFFEPLVAAYGGSLAGKHVLDLGCCQGYWSFEAARAGASTCLGLDSSQTFVREARALRTIFDLPTCEFRTAHLEDDPWWYGIGPFDVTLFAGLFYHLADPIHVLRRAMALTRETMVVDTRVKLGTGRTLEFADRRQEGPCAIHSNLTTKVRLIPTVPAVEALLDDGGFTRVEVLTPRPPLPQDDLSGKRVVVIGNRS